MFGLGSLLGGLSGSSGFLDGARALQGFGAALVAPAALSLVTTIFTEGAERNRALGVWGAVGGAGGAAGVMLGGVLTQIDWRLVLFVNVPVAALAVFVAPRVLNESKAQDVGRSFDIPGAVTVTAGLALFVYAMIKTGTSSWGSAATIERLAGAAALLIAFVIIELRSTQPLMPFRIFRVRTLRGANIAGVMTGAALFSMFLFISYYLQFVMGYGALKTGVAYLPLAVTIIVCAGVASQLVTRIGFKPTLIGGLLAVAGGLFWFSRIPVHGSYVTDVLGPSMIAGAGLGLTFVPVTIAAVSGIEPGEAGLASGLINTSQQVGGALGVAILVSIATSRIGSFGAAAHTHTALVAGYSRAFLVGAGIAAAAAMLSAVIISSRDSREQSTAARAGAVAPTVA
jgi:predicted MFS family arabinose efflux permease